MFCLWNGTFWTATDASLLSRANVTTVTKQEVVHCDVCKCKYGWQSSRDKSTNLFTGVFDWVRFVLLFVSFSPLTCLLMSFNRTWINYLFQIIFSITNNVLPPFLMIFRIWDLHDIVNNLFQQIPWKQGNCQQRRGCIYWSLFKWTEVCQEGPFNDASWKKAQTLY